MSSKSPPERQQGQPQHRLHQQGGLLEHRGPGLRAAGGHATLCRGEELQRVYVRGHTRVVLCV